MDLLLCNPLPRQSDIKNIDFDLDCNIFKKIEVWFTPEKKMGISLVCDKAKKIDGSLYMRAKTR